MEKVDKHNLKLVLAYDGTAYKGWQKTPLGPSIEDTLQRALQQIFQCPMTLQAASRTDAGVHANGQVVNLFAETDRLNLKRLQFSLNQLLPRDIVVISIDKMPDAFHPTLDVIEKEYRYRICNGPFQLPQNRMYSWHVPYALDVGSMREAAKYFCGELDFRALCNLKTNKIYHHYVRKIESIEIEEFAQGRLEIRVTGTNFLYKMVRNIVGSLVDVGKKRIAVSKIPYILASKDRTQAGITAPAHGLNLWRIGYPVSGHRWT